MTARIEVTDFTGSDMDIAWVPALVEGVFQGENRVKDLDRGVHVALVNDAEIRRLNEQFHQKDSPTDVLSFPLVAEEESEGAWDPDGEGPMAELVVSVDTARREADQRGLTLKSELALYLVHGVLHLIGYDDMDEVARERMRKAEIRHLSAAGYPPDVFSTRGGES